MVYNTVYRQRNAVGDADIVYTVYKIYGIVPCWTAYYAVCIITYSIISSGPIRLYMHKWWASLT